MPRHIQLLPGEQIALADGTVVSAELHGSVASQEDSRRMHLAQPYELLRDLLSIGLTQMTIAQETGIPQPTLSKLATGQAKDMPSRRTRKLQVLWEQRCAGQIEHSSMLSITQHSSSAAVVRNVEPIMVTVRRQLEEAKGGWSAVAEHSGVPYHTLTKIAQGKVDPRMSSVQRLVDYFAAQPGTDGANTPNA